MASKEKVNWAQLKVGILAIVALFCIVLLIFLLSGDKQFFVTEVPLHTFIDDAAALVEGSPVRINGITAGKVNKVALSGLNDPNRTIRVDFQVDDGMLKQIPVDSVATIAADNLLRQHEIHQHQEGQEGRNC